MLSVAPSQYRISFFGQNFGQDNEGLGYGSQYVTIPIANI